jgi:uncharacterized protein YndB with AHSA1/START domain
VELLDRGNVHLTATICNYLVADQITHRFNEVQLAGCAKMLNMSQPDDHAPVAPLGNLLIERTTDLDMDVDRLWSLISTSEGWKSWLVDDADVLIAPSTNGTATNDGIERIVRIDSVSAGRTVGFSWWDRDDPSSASFVQLDVVALPDGRSQLHLTERFVGATGTTASATMSSTAGVSWEVRIISLWLMAVQSSVMA